MPDYRTLRLPSAPPEELLRAIRDEPEPPGGVARAPAEKFIRRFEYAYRREIEDHKSAGRRESD